ncbi:MAG: tRNA lysidine(34) synthetase TilS [Bacteroidetes bacterium]|nr:tRNA lysidine(34) synthetase TilS [Bacteroidota bacterium]
MLERFKEYIKEKNLVSPGKTVLLAVSGGADSVAMAELFHRAGINFHLAHCNFGLRGKESDRDEKFVRALAKKYKTEIHTRKFQTESYAKKNKLSIQEAARELRYDWFRELSLLHQYPSVATAHHLNDSIETFFINLLRGTGINGLSGINPDTDDGVIRPLLFASRKEIETFLSVSKLRYCEDSSNQEDHYLRNKIRHHLIPLFEKLNPSFEKTMAKNLQNIFFAEHVFNETIIETTMRLTHHVNGLPYFSRKELKQLDFPVEYLYEFLSPFHFNAAQVKEIWECKQSGKIFYTKNFRIVCDRDKIIFSILKKENEPEHFIAATMKSFNSTVFRLTIKTIPLEKEKKFSLPNDASISCLDMDMLRFPLELRKWKAGDFFYPLGMTHRKRLSDFMIDSKWSVPEKENVHVLVSGNDIVCILGHRIDDRYKVTGRTKKVFRIAYLSKLK